MITEETNPDSISTSPQVGKLLLLIFFSDKYEADFAKSKRFIKELGSCYDKEGFFTNEDLAFVFDTRKNRKRIAKRNRIYFRTNNLAARI